MSLVFSRLQSLALVCELDVSQIPLGPERSHTFLRLPVSFVSLKLFLATVQGHGLVTTGSCERDSHGLVEQLEPLDFFNGIARAFCIIENDESLSFGLQILLDDNIDDIAKFGKQGSQGFSERFKLNALFQILDVNPVRNISIKALRSVSGVQ